MNYFTALLVAAGLPTSAAVSVSPVVYTAPAAVSSTITTTVTPTTGTFAVATVFQAYQTMAAQSLVATTSLSNIQTSLPTPSGNSVLSSQPAQQMVQLINQARVEDGLAPYTVNPVLMQLAQERALALSNGPFTSDLVQYGWPMQMEQAAGLQAQGMGAENIAEAGSVTQAFALLMASPPHKANMLNPYETQIGVGVVPWGSGVAISELFIGPNS